MTQCQLVLRHLESGQSLTPLQALRLYGTLRLGARIHDLRAKGHPIGARMVNVGDKKVASYYMERK